MAEQANSNPPQHQEDEIDLLALAKTLWENRKKILFMTLLFMGIGLFVALFSPTEYTASTTFIPQTGESGKAGGSLGGLASLAGINLGGIGGGSEIPPSLYPKIVSSVPFRKALLDAEISLPGTPKKVRYRDYFLEHHQQSVLEWLKEYTLGLPGKLLKALKGDSNAATDIQGEEEVLSLSEEEFELFKLLEEQLQVSPNEKEGDVSLSFVMPDARMAAQMAKFAESRLQAEVINFKIQNARENLDFTESQYLEKKEEFEKAQARLAWFRDRNQNVISASANNELQRLEAEYNFAFSIFTELAKQYEQAKLQVNKDTPIFSIIQPVTVPTEKSAPKRPLILVVFTFLGLIFGVGLIFGAEYLREIKNQWNTP